MPRLSHPPSLSAVFVHRKGGISYFVFAVLALLHAIVFRWLVSTVGEPYQQTVQQNERIQATAALAEGIDRRSLLSLQSGLTRAADLPTFNETLFEEGKDLHRKLRQRLDALTQAIDAEKPEAISAALSGAIELHTDGRPIVDQYHLRSAAKKLQLGIIENRLATLNLAGASAMLERVKAAIELSRDLDEASDRHEEDEKKLPSKYLPSFWASLALFGCLLALLLVHMSTHWSVAFRALLYYSPTRALEVGSYARVVPPPHRGTAEIVPLERSSDGTLFFTHQRQKFEVVAPCEEVLGGGAPDERVAAASVVPAGSVGACLPLLCPVALPLGEYAGAAGLAGAAVGLAQERFGANSFEIPLPTWIELYKEQLASPIAMFQLLCCVLWILDEYWKYTLFTLFMILSFEGTTALSRLKNMQQLRGMSAKGFSLHCYRDGAWVLVPSTSLLPSDIICLRRPAGAEPLTVPADCVVLRGGAVVNESTLTGESIPQVSAP